MSTIYDGHEQTIPCVDADSRVCRRLFSAAGNRDAVTHGPGSDGDRLREAVGGRDLHLLYNGSEARDGARPRDHRRILGRGPPWAGGLGGRAPARSVLDNLRGRHPRRTRRPSVVKPLPRPNPPAQPHRRRYTSFRISCLESLTAGSLLVRWSLVILLTMLSLVTISHVGEAGPDYSHAASNLNLLTEPTFARAVNYLRLEERRMRQSALQRSQAALAAAAPSPAAPPAAAVSPSAPGSARKKKPSGGPRPPPAPAAPAPWTGVVHAWAMPPTRAPQPGILGPRPAGHQALLAAPQYGCPAPPAASPWPLAPPTQWGGASSSHADPALLAAIQQAPSPGSYAGNGDCCGQLRQEYDSLLREKGECRRVLEDLMRENELKCKECHEAQTSLRELQMELMRKSMHVGSLVFAVEGQVKEKTRWCQLLKDLSEKFKVGRAKQDCKSKDAQIKSMEETIQSLEAKNKAKDHLLTMNLQDKIKELESQLLVERKIARQHVDNKIAQDVERKQQQQQSLKEDNNTYMRSPMSERNLNATVERPPPSAAPRKDLGMMAKQALSDSNNGGDTYSFNQLMSLAEEKENANPDAAKARRVSLCNGGAHQPRRSSLIPLPRRNSLMPLPAGGGAKTPAPAAASPLDKIKEYSSPPLSSPPVMSNDKGSRSKRINSILRRSLQKKVVIRPPPSGQAGRRAGAAAAAAQGIDSARRAAARRVPASGGPGGGAPRGVHQNRDKERGWNH